MQDIKIIEFISQCLEDKKALDIKVFDLNNKDFIADFIFIATASNTTQLNALAAHLKSELKKKKLKVKAIIGKQESNWLILDYGNYIIHILGAEEREFYQLEKIWQDAQVVYH